MEKIIFYAIIKQNGGGGGGGGAIHLHKHISLGCCQTDRCWNVYSQNVYFHNVYSQNVYLARQISEAIVHLVKQA